MWVYDYRTNVHHTLKQNPLKASDLAEFVACYNPENRFKRKELRGDSNCKFSRENLSGLSKQTDGYPLRVSAGKR